MSYSTLSSFGQANFFSHLLQITIRPILKRKVYFKMINLKLIRKISELPIPTEGKCLFILDLDKTLINENGRLIDPDTFTWVNTVLENHDVIICTYRDITSRHWTTQTIFDINFKILVHSRIVDSHTGDHGAGFDNILYATEKGLAVKELLTKFPQDRWTEMCFVDDQPYALYEMGLSNPSIKLYLMF